jgi:eukaryotic-like serine/threonine-protein kinase
MDPSRWQQI